MVAVPVRPPPTGNDRVERGPVISAVRLSFAVSRAQTDWPAPKTRSSCALTAATWFASVCARLVT